MLALVVVGMTAERSRDVLLAVEDWLADSPCDSDPLVDAELLVDADADVLVEPDAVDSDALADVDTGAVDLLVL